MTVVSDSPYRSTLDAAYVYAVPWSEFPIVPFHLHYPQGGRGDRGAHAGRDGRERLAGLGRVRHPHEQVLCPGTLVCDLGIKFIFNLGIKIFFMQM